MTLLLIACVAVAAMLPAPSARAEDAPGFELPELAGSTPRSLVDLRGRFVYLDFWASWCGPCRHALPVLDNLQRELAGERFTVLAVHLDERPEDGRAFLERFPVSYPVLSDPHGRVARAFALPGMPTSYLIDPAGRIVWRHVGFKRRDGPRIRARIIAALEAQEGNRAGP